MIISKILYYRLLNHHITGRVVIMKRNINIITDADGRKLVLINEIRFKGKRKINWDDVKK